jgi:hypothetical protein
MTKPIESASDLFAEPIGVYYDPEFDNLLLLNPATLFMLPTMQGSNNRKLCVNIEHEIKKRNLTYVGDL